jgi:hypothetical protein
LDVLDRGNEVVALGGVGGGALRLGCEWNGDGAEDRGGRERD